MLILASAARTFSGFTATAIAAADDASCLHIRPRETRDHVSYFDTLMRLRGRRPAPRRASRRY